MRIGTRTAFLTPQSGNEGGLWPSENSARGMSARGAADTARKMANASHLVVGTAFIGFSVLCVLNLGNITKVRAGGGWRGV